MWRPRLRGAEAAAPVVNTIAEKRAPHKFSRYSARRNVIKSGSLSQDLGLRVPR